ncbi:hypothetical protein G7075_14160 [Phycicoccus sp. HDW14]|nr:hypothetical protein G7075_14160 [Phycicoccus sp. HDW14]
MRVHWDNKSKLAMGFRVRIYASGMGYIQTQIVNGPDRGNLMVTGLSPGLEYGVAVEAWDYFGTSDNDSKLFQTVQAPADAPTDRTFDLNLARQDATSGPIPYLGRFPTWGDIPGGALRGVSLNAAWPALLFVKPGRATSECNNPDAVVRLAPGASLSADELTELYGSANPALPVVFLACAEPTAAVYNWIPVRVTYRS